MGGSWWGSLLTLLGALAPVFALIALGFALKRIGILSSAGNRDLNQFIYWVGLPALLLLKVSALDASKDLSLAALGSAIGAFVLGMALAGLASRGLGPELRGSVITGATRANAAFVGLPVINLLKAALPPAEQQHLEGIYFVLMGAMVPSFNIGAVFGFMAPHHGINRQGLAQTCRELVRNPLIIVCVVGIGLSLIRPGLLDGTPAGASLSLIGEAAVPLALIMTGAELEFALIRRRPVLLVVTALAKLVAMPACAWALGRLCGLDHAALIAVVVLHASPTAMASVPMARILGGDPEMMAAIIVATTTLAPFTMLAWLLLLTSHGG